MPFRTKKKEAAGLVSKGGRSSGDFNDELWAMVRLLGPSKLAALDPAAGHKFMTHRFAALVAFGLRDSDDLTCEPSFLAQRIETHAASSAYLRLLLVEMEDELQGTGGYLDLLWRWLQGRAVVLSYLYQRGGYKPNFVQREIIDHGDLDEESRLLARLLCGQQYVVPQELAFPGIHLWLTEEFGPAAEALYPTWAFTPA